MKSAAAAVETARPIDPAALTVPAAVDRLRVLALGAGVAGAVLLAIGLASYGAWRVLDSQNSPPPPQQQLQSPK